MKAKRTNDFTPRFPAQSLSGSRRRKTRYPVSVLVDFHFSLSDFLRQNELKIFVFFPPKETTSFPGVIRKIGYDVTILFVLLLRKGSTGTVLRTSRLYFLVHNTNFPGIFKCRIWLFLENTQ